MSTPSVLRLVTALVTGLGVIASAAASTTGSLPWDTPLQTITNDLTGPVATALSTGGLFAAGGTLIWGGELGGFVAMCSTQPGVYGNPDKGTEVPRAPLMQAIAAECALVRSDSFDIELSTGSVPAVDGSTPGKPKTGTLTKGALYVEYAF